MTARGVVGRDGSDLGRISQVLLDAATGQPAWITVTGDGWDGAHVVPLARARMAGGRVSVPYSSLVVQGAPRASTSEGQLRAGSEADLLRHYGLDRASGADAGEPGGHPVTQGAGRTRHEWRLPCTAQALRTLRGELRAVLDAAGLSGEELDDLVLAVSEAATNAIEHARAPAPGSSTSSWTSTGPACYVTVRDYGRWRDPVPGTGRGRGLLLMRSLAALTVTATPEGTTVTMENRSAALGQLELPAPAVTAQPPVLTPGAGQDGSEGACSATRPGARGGRWLWRRDGRQSCCPPPSPAPRT